MQADTWKYDSTVVSLPWQELKVKERLRIGLVEDDGLYTPTPPVRRGLKETVELLRRSNNVEIVPIILPGVKEVLADQFSYCSLSGVDVR
jgi:amidase